MRSRLLCHRGIQMHFGQCMLPLHREDCSNKFLGDFQEMHVLPKYTTSLTLLIDWGAYQF